MLCLTEERQARLRHDKYVYVSVGFMGGTPCPVP
jgi:hypothetical protein